MSLMQLENINELSTQQLVEKISEIGNYAIFDGYCKAVNVIHNCSTALCSVSGGSDSDVMLDIIHRVDENKKVKYYWIDTGLEYEATKKHLKYLENKYKIQINRVRPQKPIPICIKEYGVPFLSKYVSEQMMRLQKNNFQWEDEPYDVLIKKYPNCKLGLKWWCNCIYKDGKIEKISRFSISQNKYLKEFIMENPPDFPISNKCCEYSKKKIAHQIIKELDADLEITGIRQSEGGVRAKAYDSCFSNSKSKGCNTYRPLFWYKDGDKSTYDEIFNIKHSECYSKYGMKRTGCAGCPFSRNLIEELKIIENFEPKLYKAAYNLFGKSYEYRAKYDAYKRKRMEQEKQFENQLSFEGCL